MPAEETYKSEIENELTCEECMLLVDDLINLADKEELKSLNISLTGGDPLLRKDFFDIVAYIMSKQTEERYIYLSAMGTPKTLSREIIRELREAGVERMQLSADGLGKAHDEIRGEGAFSELEDIVRVFKEEKFPLSIMFTLGKYNKKELIPLMRWCNENNITGFSFARTVPLGSAKDHYVNDLFTEDEYKALLIDILTENYNLKLNGSETFYSFKEPLWELLFSEQGVDLERGNACCFAGGTISILADGTLLPCRRLPIKLGKFPEESITEVFCNSPELNKFREFSNYEKCSDCDLLKTCRGNPCISYALTGNPFAPDPQCWRED